MNLSTYMNLNGSARKTWLDVTSAALDRGWTPDGQQLIELHVVAEWAKTNTKSAIMKAHADSMLVCLDAISTRLKAEARPCPDHDTREEEAADHAADLAQAAYDALSPQEKAAADKADGVPEPPAFEPCTDLKALDRAIEEEGRFLREQEADRKAYLESKHGTSVRVVCKNQITYGPKADLAMPLFRRHPELFKAKA